MSRPLSPYEIKKFFQVKWQDGPRSKEVNGCEVEDVINVIARRVADEQLGDHPSVEKAAAVRRLIEARELLAGRGKL